MKFALFANSLGLPDATAQEFTSWIVCAAGLVWFYNQIQTAVTKKKDKHKQKEAEADEAPYEKAPPAQFQWLMGQMAKAQRRLGSIEQGGEDRDRRLYHIEARLTEGDEKLSELRAHRSATAEAVSNIKTDLHEIKTQQGTMMARQGEIHAKLFRCDNHKTGGDS